MFSFISFFKHSHQKNTASTANIRYHERDFHLKGFSLFLLSRPFYAYRLYAFSRRLAEFRLQTMLKDLPLRFLTQRSRRKIIPDLPQDQEERLTRFLAHYGVPEQTLAVYLAFCPDIVGSELSDLLFRSVWNLPDFSAKAENQERDRALELLRLFYFLSLHRKDSKNAAENFERLLNNDLDFRLEASFLERINDLFYEDENILALLPDWFVTTKDRLTLQKMPDLYPVQDSPDKPKTAATLIRALVFMLFCEGLMLIPFPACCRTDGQGRLYFTRIRMPVLLTDKERLFVSTFVEALLSGNFQAASGALILAGYASESVTAVLQMLEELEHETKALTLSQKAQAFLKKFPSLPFFFHYGAFVLKAVEKFRLSGSEENKNLWHTIAAEILSALPKEKRAPSAAQETAKRFQLAFSLAPHQEERLNLQNKKQPAFLKDPGKLSEILSRQTVASQFQPKHLKFGRVFIFLTLFFVLAALLLF